MAKTKFKGWNVRFEIMFNYYSHYYEHFMAISGVVSVDTNFHPDEYWGNYSDDVLKYLVDIAGTENTWCSHLFKIVENESGRYSSNEVERFMYWFLVHTYLIDGYTNFKELKRKIRKDYKKSMKSNF